MTPVDLPEARARLTRIEPTLLGERIKSARIASGLTQSAVTRGRLSVGYLSRIESGKRRPDLDMLGAIAEGLGVSRDDLLAKEPETFATLGPALDFAEIAVGLGDAPAALAHLESIDYSVLSPADRWRAELTRAQALEATGDLNGAIEAMELLQPLADDALDRVRLGIALSRCYRELGEHANAIRVGEAALEHAAALGLAACDESVQLSVTVAAAYFEQGERNLAVRICRRAISVADQLESPKAKASAYWNASVMSLEQGHVADAVPLARQALTLLQQGSDGRNLAILRMEVGLMELRLDPPEVLSAREDLADALGGLGLSNMSHVNVLRTRLGLARCDMLDGFIDAAAAASDVLIDELATQAPLLRTDGFLLAAQVASALGDVKGAQARLIEAVFHLTAAGNDREAAERWMDAGTLLESVEDWQGAKDAYRAAAVASGLRPRLVPTAIHQAELTF